MRKVTRKIERDRQFVEAILGGSRKGFAELRGPALGSCGRWGRRWFELADPRSLGALTADAVELGGRGDLYLGTAPRMRRRGRVEDVGPGRVLAVDVDDPKAVEALADFILPPSITVRTGSVTDNVPHVTAIWLLDRLTDPRIIASLQRRLRDLIGGDASYNASAATVCRLPGTLNHKHGQPSPVDLSSFNSERTYSGEEIETELPIARRSVRLPRPTPKTGAFEEIIEQATAKTLAEIESGRGRNDAVFYVWTRELWEAGLAKEQVTEDVDDLVEAVMDIAPGDHPFLQSEVLASLRSRWTRGVKVEIPSELEAVKRAASTYPWLARSASRQTILGAMIRKAEREGKLTITVSVRWLEGETGLARATVESATARLKSEGWIQKAGRGARKAQKWRLRIPGDSEELTASQSENPPSSTSSFYVSCPNYGNAALDPSHDAFSWGAIGQAARLTLGLLASQSAPVSLVDFAAVHPRTKPTVLKHLQRLRDHDLAKQLPCGRWQADLENAEAKLDSAAEELGTAGRGKRRQRRHGIERSIFREAQARFAVEQDRKRQVEAENRMRRVCQRRHRKPNVDESVRVDDRRFTLPPPSGRREFRIAHLSTVRPPTERGTDAAIASATPGRARGVCPCPYLSHRLMTAPKQDIAASDLQSATVAAVNRR